MKVLIIDDDPDALEVAKVRLTKEELEISCAEGGVLGLKAARTNHRSTDVKSVGPSVVWP